jgi:hypothetical protein
MSKQRTFNLRNGSTPLTIGTFVITGFSGLLLFFHFGEGLLKEAHEWIGLAFVLGALLHVRSNWSPFKRYFSSALPKAVIGAVLAASVAVIAVSASESGGSPVRAVMHSIEKAPLTLIAQLQQRDEQALVRLLEASGMTVMDPAQSIEVIAAANSKSVREVIPLLFERRG